MEKDQALPEAVKPEVNKSRLTPAMKIFETAINLWWKNLMKFVKVYLWGFVYALVPLLILLIIFGVTAWQGSNLGLSVRILFGILSALSMLVVVYFSIQAYAGIFLLVKNNYEGNPEEMFKSAQKYVFPYLWLTILTIFFIILWSILIISPVIIFFIFSSKDPYAASFILKFIFIIPGAILSIFYSMAVYAFFFEDLRGRAAIRRSRELVWSCFWLVFGRYLLLFLAALIFSAIISAPLNMIPEKTIFWEIWNAVVQIINIIIGPIVLIFSYQIYQDLVKIKK